MLEIGKFKYQFSYIFFNATPQIGELSVVGSQIEVNSENAQLHDMCI